MHDSDTNAVCRNCGMILKGKPYHMGGTAYHPHTNEQCPVNHYGGFVCSRVCDYHASLKQLRSMPQCGTATRLDCYADASLKRNWGGAGNE
jgi:ribosomal protein L34E